MSKETLIAVGAGVLSAIAGVAFLSRSAGALFFVYVASLPLFMAGLALGPRAVMIGGGIGFFTAGLLGGGFVAGVYGLMQTVPAWLMVKQLLLQRPGDAGGGAAWYPIGQTLGWLAMLAAGILVMAAIMTGSSEPGFAGTIADSLDSILTAMAPQLDEARRAAAVAMMAPIFPGAIGGSAMVMSVVNAVLAQHLVTRMKRNLRPTPAYADLLLPQWMSWPLVGSAALALIGSGDLQFTGRNLTLVLAVPFFFVGLAVVHTWARRVAYTGVVVVVFYLVLLLSGWAMLAVAGLGMAEQWIGLRGRFAGSSRSGPPASLD
ncbi:MAG TPA: DUF2232 domain-containing protein [Rhodospirillales bacterium]